MNDLVQKIMAGINADTGEYEAQEEAAQALLELVAQIAALDERLSRASKAWEDFNQQDLDFLLLGRHRIEGI